MRYYQIDSPDSGLVVRTNEEAYDLGTSRAPVDSFLELAKASTVSGTDVDSIASRLVETAETVPRADFDGNLARPLSPDEVWAAGVTYEISESAREEESEKPDVYIDVYDSERPELFFKATASRTVGHGEDVGIRHDSSWNVPEPELGLVLYRGEIVGYTIGNDVSSRSIEGENPLYLPQAKVYNRCCAIGPGIVSAGSIDDPHDLGIQMTITRDGGIEYEGTTTTARMHRTCQELTSFYCRHNSIPELAVLLTGTSLVPDDGFTLREGDSISISIDSIGRLENTVTEV
ncbi:fumarylacetoacetate hydrolase family protein [Halorarum salinum]|uniref:Fumarylacetoacetate hydrolase family protein n=1 Tax=Halorarum salinum TaxID=2743089 RepID=A0A7D5L922_9EURY|nr:fumarylacetoacetate hydrolase family protein [Halobaculum salinum]QLG61166.1 fumarylacetoacetate hydrolase family protein [Halobaculum salinum]